MAALAEMEPTLSIPKNTREEATSNWRESVIDMVKSHENLNYFSEAEDTASIVSVRIKHPETGAWMVKAELAKVFRAMTLDMDKTLSEKVPDLTEHEHHLLSKICFIGQPVLISKL